MEKEKHERQTNRLLSDFNVLTMELIKINTVKSKDATLRYVYVTDRKGGPDKKFDISYLIEDPGTDIPKKVFMYIGELC